MSKKRGLSADEKRAKMLEIFYEKKDFFQLKELEKIAPKEKGIIQQSVKEVVQALVDDHLVESEKIGTSIYFWAFPSKAIHTKKRKLVTMQTEAEECAKKLKKTECSLIAEKCGREESDERSRLLQELECAAREERVLQAELQRYRDSDPDYINQLAGETTDLKDAINRWTENIYILKSFCKNKFSIEENTLNKNFGIPEDLDYEDC